jgi:hypothetical protein
VLLLGFSDAYAGVKCEAPPPGPLANTLEDDAMSSPTTAAHDRILFIGSLSLAVDRERPCLTDNPEKLIRFCLNRDRPKCQMKSLLGDAKRSQESCPCPENYGNCLGTNEKTARLRRPISKFNLTNGDDVASRNGGLGPIRNDDLDHRDGPSRALG